MGDILWVNFKKIYEDEICVAVKPSKFVGNSMYILKAKDLKEIFLNLQIVGGLLEWRHWT